MTRLTFFKMNVEKGLSSYISRTCDVNQNLKKLSDTTNENTLLELLNSNIDRPIDNAKANEKLLDKVRFNFKISICE